MIFSPGLLLFVFKGPTKQVANYFCMLRLAGATKFYVCCSAVNLACNCCSIRGRNLESEPREDFHAYSRFHSHCPDHINIPVMR